MYHFEKVCNDVPHGLSDTTDPTLFVLLVPFMDTGTPGHCGSHLSATERITASGNLFWASESNSKTYSEKQNGSSGDEISVSSESQKVIEFVMHEPMTNDERTKKRAGTSKTNQKKPPKGHSDKHWEMLRDNHLRRLYIQESHTVDEVVFEMLVIHGHRLTYVILCAYTLLSSKTRSIAD